MVSKDTIPFKSIRFVQSPGDEPFVDAYLSDLKDVVGLVASGEIIARGPKADYTWYHPVAGEPVPWL